ncbi:hypothetical protein LTR05_000725 [Lithohypha guttulata]|uniref:N-acetyltransferase domain-containing protein n=1 Tax=Lithohypha guttulata TaxID=1690604 RepID=A0AAN7TC70_9EURO|nr:hypothetical protein LTR05_000725 [Lithohypha guttulata]
MLINKNVAVYTNKVSLVPYCKHHVAKYHGWMKDPDLQVATASEPLTLEAEYAMQRSWRTDSDKLTFISCLAQPDGQTSQREDIASAIGDVNLFVVTDEEESGELVIAGEVEIMVAERQNRYQGTGRAALLVFLKYVLAHETEILKEYFSTARDNQSQDKFAYLRAKINETNGQSLRLFESVGFERSDVTPNFFGEWELRKRFSIQDIEKQMEEKMVSGYREVSYPYEEEGSRR